MIILISLLALGCGDKDTDSGQQHQMTSSTGDTGDLDFGRTQDTDGGTYSVTWAPSPEPAVGDDFTVGISVTSSETDFTVTGATAMMPNHGHGMNVDPVVVDNGDGTATASPFQFQMEGWWEITVDVTGAGGTETATFNHYCCD